MRAARVSTFAYFALNGFVVGMWVVHIPEIEHRAGVTHATLGLLLLLLGGGAFLGMQVAGPLTDRLGTRRMVPLTAVLCSAFVVLPGLATSGWTLGVALLLFGFGNGSLDVAMNVHAVEVERGYGRPVMSAFHAMWSIGGVCAALVGALTLSWGWNPSATLSGVIVLGVVVTAIAAPTLLRPQPGAAVTDKAPRRKTSTRVWAMAVVAFLLMLCEGVANDWSVLHLSTILDAPAATAAFAYGSFATAMTIGRFAADRVAHRFGAFAIVRYGGVVAALGLTVVVFSPWIPLALAGWTVFGIGLSGCIPQLFGAAGHTDLESAGTNVSRVAGLGYLGMLAGPMIIGPLTVLMPLNFTFLLPVVFCLVASGAARILRPRPALVTV
ncbi:MFS transporter [Actinocrispum wychmicini]|uniref:Fucose permease n=1 Tax=Actinocrispum wychmicini TaxID=1213861 RepID=A0A4R2IZD3_9PSEU|nr:MFS transporter [Actinocrispum wychmicini]TCO49738.1 fucose permease [Actinocrispum wychmicini]